MKITKDFKRFLSEMTLGVFLVTSLNPAPALAASGSDKIIYPLKQISKLECRFSDFKDLTSSCKQDLPVLNTDDYKKYASKDWGYNDFTRIYTVLWWASYKYWWDIWNGGHIWTDIATSRWTPVYSMANWKVIKAKNDIMLWNLVTIEHNIKWKKVVSSYAHLSKIDVKLWETVKVWRKIWEVWSTWNSTWNHLHFQIDLESKFYPYYYDYNKCPYSYYKISEEGICIDELKKHTVDPLLFLETSAAILDKISTTTISSDIVSTSEDLSIFNRTVYIGYSKTDIKRVQEIYKKLGIYKWSISWDYKDIENTIIAYQISNKLIKDKNDYWAWWFWPKTRAETKKDYLVYLEDWTKTTDVEFVHEQKEIETQKIERVNLMSREEIEKREVDEFLRYHNISLDFVNKGWNVKVWDTETLKLNITTRKGKPFKWEMPGGMTFIVNTENVSVFPERLFYFTDWKRDIKISWLKEWNTNLYIKIWTQTIKTIPIKIFSADKAIYPTSSRILSPTKITLWEKQTWIIVFEDSSWKSLINLKYWSTYNIKATEENLICIKEGNIANILKVYKSTCSEDEYKNEFNFTYDDTVWWLLIFDYKATSKNFWVSVTNNYNSELLSEKKILVSNPKWLNNTYAYTQDVMTMLEEWIVDWINKWYFLENRWLTQRDAITWIENALIKMNDNVYDNESKNIIEKNLKDIEKVKPYSSRTKVLSREEFLDLNYKYLVIEDIDTWQVEYRDIDTDTSQKLSKIFDENTTWKDQFGEKYFRPEAKITRWEWAFFLSKTLERNANTYLTLK